MTVLDKQHTEKKIKELPFILRAVWFFLMGWHLTGGWILVAWIANLTIVGLPLGLWMLNRVPQILTLKSVGGSYIENSKSGEATYHGKAQVPFLLRAAYFLVFGWWVSLGWAAVGYLLCLSIVGLPFGLLMLNRLPFVTTLGR